MQLNTMRCKECKGEMTIRPLDSFEGEEHGVRLRIRGMPVMQCDGGHKRLVAPEFAVRMMETLLADDSFAPVDEAAQKGLFRKRYCCPSCGQALDEASGDHFVTESELEIGGLNAFSVKVDLPKYRCAACGHESVEPVEHLRKASVEAFRSAGIAPA